MRADFLQLGTGHMPATPTLSLSASGTTVTATITGAAGATHYLKYKPSSGSAWLDGGSRTGDGTIAVPSLSYDVPYSFTVISQIGFGPYSLPAPVATALITEASEDNDFDTALASDASIFLDAFGEDIVYLPIGGGSRSIRAVVTRERPAQFTTSRAKTPKLIIHVANNSTIGISSTEIDKGGDQVTVAVRLGETAQNKRITKIIGQDAGMLKLEIN